MSDLPVPHEAEQAVLGAILRAGKLPADVEAILSPDDFADPHKAAVYAAVVDLAKDGHDCDHVAVISRLDPAARRALDNGLQLAEFMETAPVGGTAYHAQIVAKAAERRRYYNAALKIAQAARDEAEDIGGIARAAVDSVPRLLTKPAMSPWDILASIVDPDQEQPGILLGLPDLDDGVNPLLPGAITTIGARSRIGKSTFALDILRRAAYRYKKRCLFISIEMSDREVFQRILSAEAMINANTILKGLPRTPAEERREGEAVTRIAEGSLIVRDVDSLSLSDFRAIVREEKPDLVAVDFLGMMQLEKAERHDLAVTSTVYGIKQVADQEQCHVIILSQFNRSADSRNDKRPVLGDLRDSAGLEQASHLIMLLHRPDLYEEEDRPGEVDVIVAKQRNGKSDFTVSLAATLHYSQFSPLATPWQQAHRPDNVVDITQPTRHQEPQ